MDLKLSSCKRKRDPRDDDDCDEPDLAVASDESHNEEGAKRSPLVDQGKDRDHRDVPDFDLRHQPNLFDGFRGDPTPLLMLAAGNSSRNHVPSLNVAHNGEDGNNCKSSSASENTQRTEIDTSIATSPEIWVARNTPLLQQYSQRQIDPPLGSRLDISLNDRTTFVKGFLMQLTERPSSLMSRSGRGATGSTDMLDGFINIHHWAKGYLQRIGQGQTNDLVSVIYVIMANAFYECHLDLVDAISRRALDNMRAESRNRLEVKDFALRYDLKIAQSLPFCVEVDSVIDKAIQTSHPGMGPQIPKPQQETRSGRKVNLSSKGESYYRDEQEKASKAWKARALRTSSVQPSSDGKESMGPPPTLRRSRAKNRSSNTRMDSTSASPMPDKNLPSPGPSGLREFVGDTSTNAQSIDPNSDGSTPLGIHLTCPNCGHITNSRLSDRTGLWSVTSWQPEGDGRIRADDLEALGSIKTGIQSAAVQKNCDRGGAPVGARNSSLLSVETEVTSVPLETAEATRQANSIHMIDTQARTDKQTLPGSNPPVTIRDDMVQIRKASRTNGQQASSTLSERRTNKMSALKLLRTTQFEGQLDSLRGPAVYGSSLPSSPVSRPPGPLTSPNQLFQPGHLRTIKIPPIMNRSKHSCTSLTVSNFVEDDTIDHKVPETTQTKQQPTSESAQSGMPASSAFTFRSILPTRSVEQQAGSMKVGEPADISIHSNRMCSDGFLIEPGTHLEESAISAGTSTTILSESLTVATFDETTNRQIPISGFQQAQLPQSDSVLFPQLFQTHETNSMPQVGAAQDNSVAGASVPGRLKGVEHDKHARELMGSKSNINILVDGMYEGASRELPDEGTRPAGRDNQNATSVSVHVGDGEDRTRMALEATPSGSAVIVSAEEDTDIQPSLPAADTQDKSVRVPDLDKSESPARRSLRLRKKQKVD